MELTQRCAWFDLLYGDERYIVALARSESCHLWEVLGELCPWYMTRHNPPVIEELLYGLTVSALLPGLEAKGDSLVNCLKHFCLLFFCLQCFKFCFYSLAAYKCGFCHGFYARKGLTWRERTTTESPMMSFYRAVSQSRPQGLRHWWGIYTGCIILTCTKRGTFSWCRPT
jgi:hypothetical protein